MKTQRPEESAESVSATTNSRSVDREWRRVAYNIKPPARSGLRDFPDCLWCKKHESIVLPVDKFKHKIGTREDWYYWDPVEAHTRAMRLEGAEHKMIHAGWRMNQASQGFKNY
eukprot:3101624-Amphidinium_carterae.1